MMVKDGDKARIQTIQNCLSCPLCSNLLRKATAINPCLHTFCKVCIDQKLESDGTNCCPVCNVYLGCSPKLRYDGILQSLRDKIFQVKEVKSSKASPTKRKEKSISSLSITATPSVSGSKKGMARGTSQEASMSKKTEANCPGKDVKGVIKNSSSSSSRDGLNKLSTSSKKPVTLGIGDQSHDIVTHSECPTKPQCSLNTQGEVSEWESLSVLAETANRAENLNMDLSNVPAYKMVSNDNPYKKQTRLRTAWELKSGQPSTTVNDENDDLLGKITTLNTNSAPKINDSNELCNRASNASGSIANMENNDNPHIKQTRRLRKGARKLKSGQTSTIMKVKNDDLSSKITNNADGVLKINDYNEQCLGDPNASGSANNMENNDNPHIKQTRRPRKSVWELKSAQTSTIVIVEDDDLPSKVTTTNADDALKISDSNERRTGALKINDSNEQCIGSSDKMENNDTLHIKQTRRRRKSAMELKSVITSPIVIVEDDDLACKITTPNTNDALKISDSNEQYAGASNASESSNNSLRRLHPVWFLLLACRDTGRTPFPQIPMKYIRIKDGSVPVTFLSKYVALKLEKTHESEVEIMCCGQVAPPNAMLLDLVNIWENSKPNMKSPSDCNMDSPSDDANDLVMILTYRRKEALLTGGSIIRPSI